MKRHDIGGLGWEVRKVGGTCLESSDALGAWLREHPEVDVLEARSVVGVGRGVAFPSIRGLVEGPFPVRPEHPFWDGRVLGFERGEIRVNACLHEEAVTVTRIDPQTSPGLPR